MMYEVIQHADNLRLVYIRNRKTGRIVMERITIEQAARIIENLERLVCINDAAHDAAYIWPKDLNV